VSSLHVVVRWVAGRRCAAPVGPAGRPPRAARRPAARETHERAAKARAGSYFESCQNGYLSARPHASRRNEDHLRPGDARTAVGGTVPGFGFVG